MTATGVCSAVGLYLSFHIENTNRGNFMLRLALSSQVSAGCLRSPFSGADDVLFTG